MILGVDPGNTHSAYCLWDGKRVIRHGDLPNADLLAMLEQDSYELRHTPEGRKVVLAVEMVACYGMPVGNEVFDTVLWIGRFVQAWRTHFRLIYRMEVKMHLCQHPRAKDANVRQRLLDLYGPVGTKKNPGPLYGVSKHIWAALGVAVTAHETRE